ncbi:hypothetical protein VP01_4085g1 [Puccinia sorghi]|uniref:CxC1-like cysteine cluster associated with KDZ transposases domain-containing protein n=1 Tax=Puccinia sorghi TaxID=27349 RepID=A0A0L6URF6_9BASI|nr:hypothetical protein VP01_4085g1 [Puccinia sorghi]
MTGLLVVHLKVPGSSTPQQNASKFSFPVQVGISIGSTRNLTSKNVPPSRSSRIKISSYPSPGHSPARPRLQIGIPQRSSEWVDEQPHLSEETVESMLRIRSYNEGLLLQQKQRQWMDQMALLFPTYLHMKKLTNNWTLDTWDSDYSSKVCQCTVTNSKLRSVDLVDLMGQKREMVRVCSYMPDAIFLLSRGYIVSTPVFPLAAFSVCLLNFHDLIRNLCNAHTTPFADVIRRWNESSMYSLGTFDAILEVRLMLTGWGLTGGEARYDMRLETIGLAQSITNHFFTMSKELSG